MRFRLTPALIGCTCAGLTFGMLASGQPLLAVVFGLVAVAAFLLVVR